MSTIKTWLLIAWQVIWFIPMVVCLYAFLITVGMYSISWKAVVEMADQIRLGAIGR